MVSAISIARASTTPFFFQLGELLHEESFQYMWVFNTYMYYRVAEAMQIHYAWDAL